MDVGGPKEGVGTKAGSAGISHLAVKRKVEVAREKANSTRFTQSDIRRALKGAMAAGVPIKVEIDPNGKMHLIPIQPGAPLLKDTLQDRIDRTIW